MMTFLSDIMEAGDALPSNPALECIVFSTLWGQVLSQEQDFKSGQPSAERNATHWQRHASLGNLVAQRTDIFLKSHLPSNVLSDPLLLFTNMMATTVQLVHRQAAESIPCQTNEQQEALHKYREEAEAAAHQLLRLSKHLPSRSLLKVFTSYSCPPFATDAVVLTLRLDPQMLTFYSLMQIHPFTPVPLFHCAVFLAGRTNLVTGGLETEIGEIIAVLREMQQVNPACKIFLDRFEGTSYMGIYQSITGSGLV